MFDRFAICYALDYPQALHALKAIALGTAWLLNTIAGVIYHALA